MTDVQHPTSDLTADRNAIAAFLGALFRYADDGTFVSWRAFRDDTKDAPPVFIESSLVSEERSYLIDVAEALATRAAAGELRAVFCPPIATFSSPKRAREADLANGLALSVECDAHPERAREQLERLLGPATVVVASGGLWRDPETDRVHEKLHLHWRLSEPTSAPEDHARLKRARILATALAGGDATNVPAVHPIRWPGSWHRKGTPRLAKIVELRPDAELSLTDALERLEEIAGTLRSHANGNGNGTHAVDGDVASTSLLVQQLLSGEAMHAPLTALAYRYLRGGMADAQVVLTLRGLMDAVPIDLRNKPDAPQRWEGHYRDIPRAVRTAREKLGSENGTPPPAADVSTFVGSVTTSPLPVHFRKRIAEPPPEVPKELLEPPGVLADIARYGIESAVRPVPIFAVQAALTLGSVVCARRYMTSQRNYSSLYFLNVAKSGTGKEEAKTTIERILTAANARRLIAGSSYSSGNAVFSALLRKPQHLTIIDEFGKYLEAASSTRDSFRADALTQLMEAFGRLHGDMATPQFSTMTLSPKAQADHEPRVIARPAITLLALTTPSTFYNTMTSTRVLDGFLNRFLVVEHDGPRTPMVEWRDVPVPEKAAQWVVQMLSPLGNLDVGTQIDHVPDPILVEIDENALRKSKAFERDMLKLSEELEKDGLGDMPIRAREISLRLALITALADAPDTPYVTSDVLDWSVSYVRFFLLQTIRAIRDRVADTGPERVRNAVLGAIRAAGDRGVTNRELHRGKAFVTLSRRERVETIESLLEAELIAWAEVPASDEGGRPRKALLAIDDAAESSKSLSDGVMTGVPELVHT